MFRRLLALFAVFCVVCISAPAQVDVGASREEVLRLFGKPTSIAQRGERELFLYPKGSRIELVGGKVADIRGPLPPVVATPVAPAPTQNATPAAEPTPATEPASPPAAAPGIASNLSAADPKQRPPAAPKTNPTLERLSSEIEKMEKGGHEHDEMPERGFNVLQLLLSIVLHFGITLFALRVAFKYWEMDAFWRGTLAIAGIDLAVYAVLELLGPLTSGISTSAGVQGGIGTLVMVPTIQHFCFNKRLQNAVLTALAVKMIVQLCHMFVFVILMHALFG